MSQIMSRMKVLFKYKDLVGELVKRDLKLKYRRSVLGYVWSVLNPLLIMLVLTVVFSTMFNRDIKNYPVYLLTGRMLHEFLKQSTTAGMKSVTSNAALLKKVYVPKYIFTLSKVTSCLVDTMLSMGALFIVMIATGAKFYWHILLSPLVICQIYLFALGLGFLLGQMNVFFRDTEHIYAAVTTAWFYLTPIIYPIEKLSGMPTVQWIVTYVNPLSYYVNQFRSFVYYGTFPDLKIFAIGWALAFAMLLIGMYFFRRSKDKFILYV